MQSKNMPMVLRSRLEISKGSLLDSIKGLTETAEIFTMAQEATFNIKEFLTGEAAL